jgi:hypothetical protein
VVTDGVVAMMPALALADGCDARAQALQVQPHPGWAQCCA